MRSFTCAWLPPSPSSLPNPGALLVENHVARPAELRLNHPHPIK
ncbi:hypothetical protein ACFWP1_24410 [Streptomyces sp. NPDC058425]